MPSRSTDLSALLGSRICHDLISPIGAISNGVELLQLSGSDSPELALIAEAVESANQRIRFFRVAFGAAAQGQSVGAAEIAKILTPDAFGPKINLDWQPDTDLAKGDVKLIFLALLCLETCMPYGGDIQVIHHNASWQITGRAERFREAVALWQMTLQNTHADLPSPAQVHFAMIGPELENQGRQISLGLKDTEITIAF